MVWLGGKKLVCGALLCPGHCCLPLSQPVTSQAGHVKLKYGSFYNLVDMEIAEFNITVIKVAYCVCLRLADS